MSKTRAVVVLLLVVLSGCAANTRQVRLDSTLRLYENAIRWGHYPEALALQQDAATAPLDLDDLKAVKVTAYEPLGSPVVSDGGNTVEQTVEIRFYHEDYGKERAVIDKQRWRYDEEREVWLREGGMPDFTAATR